MQYMQPKNIYVELNVNMLEKEQNEKKEQKVCI